FPAKAVRDALAALDGAPAPVEWFSRWVGERSAEMLKLCIDQGYIDPAPKPAEYGEGMELHLTESGRRLALAKFGKPLKRELADKLYGQFMTRVAELNADSHSPLFASKVAVYGSYLDPTKDEIGDIDIAVGMAYRRNHFPKGSHPIDR